MKSIYILLVSFFISISPAKSDITPIADELLTAYKQVVSCQAGFKIVAYYTGIYNSLSLLLDKNESSANANSLDTKLRADFTKFEYMLGALKKRLVELNVDVQFEENFYKQSQIGIVIDGLSNPSTPTHVVTLMTFVNACNDIKVKVEEYMKENQDPDPYDN